MSGIEKKALRLTELIDAAVLDKQHWQPLLEAIASAVDGQGGMLRLYDCTNQKVGFFASLGYDPNLVQAYRNYYIFTDPYRKFFEKVTIGLERPAPQLKNHSSIVANEYHNDFSRPQGKEYMAGTTLVRDENNTVHFGIQRNKQAGNFKEEDLKLLRLLTPHLTVAILLQRPFAFQKNISH